MKRSYGGHAPIRLVFYDSSVAPELYLGRNSRRLTVLSMRPILVAGEDTGHEGEKGEGEAGEVVTFDTAELIAALDTQGIGAYDLERDPARVFWGLDALDDVPLLLRAVDFPDMALARADAAAVLARSRDLTACAVEDARGRLASFWLVLGGDIVLVRARGWSPHSRPTAASQLRLLDTEVIV